MEQTKKITYDILCPNPYTERAYSSNLAVSSDGKLLAYCMGNSVVLRSLEDFKTARVYGGHKAKTSAVSFSPSGYFACSGDIEGNLKIWFLDDLSNKKEYAHALSGKINGIEWNGDSDRIFFYGEGRKEFARCIMWDSGNNTGDFSLNGRVLLAGDIKKTRPYRVATGGEELKVNFYEGPPFRFSKMHQTHKGFVSGIRYSPDYTKFVSVAFDKRIIVYDGKAGTELDLIADDKTEGNHTMAIIAVCWLDNSTIATCSLDKSVKIWDITEKKVKFTLYPKDKDTLDVSECGCGINTNGKYVFSLTLNGKLHFWKIADLADEKLPDMSIDGHQNSISRLIFNKTTNEIISGDYDGKVIVWDANKNDKMLPLHDKKIVSFALSPDDLTLFSVDSSGLVSSYDLTNNKQNYKVQISGDPQNIVASRLNSNTVYVLSEQCVNIFVDGTLSKELSLTFFARSIEVNESLGEIYIGDSKGNVHLFDLDLNFSSKFTPHLGEVTAIKLSPDGKLVASGDNKQYIFIWDAQTKEVIIDRFTNHSSRILDLSWSLDSTHLVSCSLDRVVIVWNVAEKHKEKDFLGEFDLGFAVTFINDGKELAVGGDSCAIKKIPL